ncbi:hypothetical protein BAE44_0022908 [Dichanthelium oligosanthes]|uniref:PDZ domain-containing protein n=1 Tax=Dichanthelium oligosanthes TaxID=888268 RepID=A0A1E5UT82_9POAL|nr:hypothetical protein BAE44_0022908 [Dichanthelium oligosanthes]
MRRKPKDTGTTDAMLSTGDKVMVQGVAHSIVSISSITHDGSNGSQCTGIIMGKWESNGKQHTLIATCSKISSNGGTLLDPIPKLSVGLPNKTILDGQFLFFNDHYGIALLEINVDIPLQRPSIGSGPGYGQEFFVLATDIGLPLRARHGKILWLEESDYIDRSYQMFLSYEVPVTGNGGPVIDHDGNVTGMAFYSSPDPVVLSISNIMTCIEMCHMSAAESLGILPGDVIVSLYGRHALTLPQLEDYLLSLGWAFLNNSSTMVDIRARDAKQGSYSGDFFIPLSFDNRMLALRIKPSSVQLLTPS